MPKSTKIFLIFIAVVAAFLLGTLFAQAPNTDNQNQVAQNNTTSQNKATPSSEGTANHTAQLEVQAQNEANNPKIWAELGNHYYDTGKATEAIEAYKKSLAIEPNNPNVLTDLGTMYRSNKEFALAVESYKKALAIDPGHKNARYNLGIVQIIDLHQLDEGVQAWQTLFSLYPNEVVNGVPFDLYIFETLEKQAQHFASADQVQKAIDCYNQYLSLEPRSESILTEKAMLLEKNNRIPEAKEAWLDLLKVNPGASTLDGQPVHTLEILQN